MYLKNQRGYTLLVSAVILILGITITALIATKSAYFHQKEQNNQYQQNLAFQAAEAGLEYGMAYLNNNRTTIVVDANNNGYIDGYTNAAITNVAHTNGTTFNVVYTNPVISNFSTLAITSTGTANNGSVIRYAKELIQIYPIVPTAPPAAIVSKNSVALSGNVAVTVSNNETGVTIWSGGDVSLAGSAQTDAGNGIGSDRTYMDTDVVLNDAGISSLTNDQFFRGFFGQDKSAVQQSVDVVYNYNNNTNLSSSLDGVTGRSIWINQTGGIASFSGNAVVGSPEHPVILVINGPFSANGTTIVYGMVYIIGDWNNGGGGNLTVNGSLVVEGALSGTGTPDVNYSLSILSNLNQLGEYVRLPGSWRDF